MINFAELERQMAPTEVIAANKKHPDVSIRTEARVRLWEENRPLVNSAISIFEQFYATQIYSKVDSEIVPKWGKYKRGTKISSTNIHFYELLFNLVRPNKAQVRGYQDSFAPFAQPGPITHHDWNPNVLLQYRVGLYSPLDKQKRFKMMFLPRVIVKVWSDQNGNPGGVSLESGILKIINKHDESGHESMTIIFHPEGEVFEQQRLLDQVNQALTTIEPFVLGHHKLWG